MRDREEFILALFMWFTGLMFLGVDPLGSALAALPASFLTMVVRSNMREA